MSEDITDTRAIHITRIACIFMLNINYGQQYKLGKLLIVFILMFNINYIQQYKLSKLLIVCIFMLNINYTLIHIYDIQHTVHGIT
jgi:hypothetical protein